MSEDLIRRSDAIKAIASLHILADEEKIFKVYADNPHSMTTDFEGTLIDAINAIKSIPTIEPKRGWWETVFMSEATGWDVSVAGRDPIYGHRCSICKEETFNNDVGEEMLTNFCPNCGARMKGADDDQ